ncbi:MAG: hypothetical protein JO142_12205 [Burkholderiales bacterium]|nr:hypothetical protein [Burkholderiales bacterium]
MKRSYICLAMLFAVSVGAEATDNAALTETPANAQHTWHKLDTEPYKGKQDDVFFVDRKVGFYVNGKGNIFRSDDGGDSWRKVLSQPGTYFRAIGMLDAQHGFAGNIGTEYFPGVTDEKPLYETSDGGQHWSAVANLPGEKVRGICAIDVLKTHYINAGKLDDRVIVHAAGRVGGPAFLLRSLDGGKTWANIDMNKEVAAIVDVKFFDEMNGVAFAGSDADIERSHALIVATHDGGKSWKKVYESSRLFEMTWKGYFPSRKIGFATVQNYDENTENKQRYVVKTTDGGETWQELPLVSDHGVNEFGVGFLDEQTGWVGTSKGGFETRDGGAHWQAVELGRYVNKFRFVRDQDDTVAYAIGADVYRWSVSPPPSPTNTTEAPVSVSKP